MAVADVASALGWHEGMPAEESAEVRAEAAIAAADRRGDEKHRDAFVASPQPSTRAERRARAGDVLAAQDAKARPRGALSSASGETEKRMILTEPISAAAADAYSFHRGVTWRCASASCSERNAIGNALAASLRRRECIRHRHPESRGGGVNEAGRSGAPGAAAGRAVGGGEILSAADLAQ